MAKKYLDGLKTAVLSCLVKYGRNDYIEITKIRNIIKEDKDNEWVWDSRVRDELAEGYGILTHITCSINQLRNDGHPILSSSIQGKGYTYANDWNRKDLDAVWDDKFNANERRKSIPKAEKETDIELFKKLLDRVTKAVFDEKINSEIRKKLLIVAEKHKVNLKDKEEETEEDEN